MPALSLPTVWNWLRTRASEWNATGLLPPRDEPLRWPHWVKLYLVLAAVITLAAFLFFFASFFSLYFAGLYWPPPPLTVGSFLHAVVRCWQIETGIRTSGFGMALGPLQIITYFWNRRVACLTRQNAAQAAPTDSVWPPPPTRPDA